MGVFKAHVDKADLEIFDQYRKRLLKGIATNGCLGQRAVGRKLQPLSKLKPEGWITTLDKRFATQGTELLDSNEIVRMTKHGWANTGSRQ